MLLATLHKTQINKGLKDYLTLCLVDSNRKLDYWTLITQNLYELGLIFELFAQVFNLCGG
jgi:hypothetical protein